MNIFRMAIYFLFCCIAGMIAGQLAHNGVELIEYLAIACCTDLVVAYFLLWRKQ